MALNPGSKLGPYEITSLLDTGGNKRFLMIKENEQVSAATVVNVVLNWIDELKQRIPVK